MKNLFLFICLSIFTFGVNDLSAQSAKSAEKTTEKTAKKESKKEAKNKSNKGQAKKDEVLENKTNGKPAQTGKPEFKQGVHMKFEKESVPLGRIKKGDTRSFSYEFQNVGTETIEISTVSSCECTKVDWPRGPIKPGEKRSMKVTFDSTEKEITAKDVDVDIYLKNLDPKTKSQIFKYLKYTFDLY